MSKTRAWRVDIKEQFKHVANWGYQTDEWKDRTSSAGVTKWAMETCAEAHTRYTWRLGPRDSGGQPDGEQARRHLMTTTGRDEAKTFVIGALTAVYIMAEGYHPITGGTPADQVGNPEIGRKGVGLPNGAMGQMLRRDG